ncbi:TPA: hypothetical protein ACH3X2_001227 [Trebouxia sp. C0005]
MRIDKSLALYRKETANSVKLAVPHIGLCPSHEDFERIALKILRRRDLEDIDPETLNNHLEIITLARKVMKMSFRGKLESKTKDALYTS